jgi:hypothetical protein
MTGRVLLILREHCMWDEVKDLHDLYEVLLEHGFEPDEMDDNSLRLTVESFVKQNGKWIYKIFWVSENKFEREIE